MAPLKGSICPRRRSSTPLPTAGRRRDSGWRVARLPFAADAARGVRRDDHPDGSRHRAINGPPRRAQDRSADAHPVHERQRSAPGRWSGPCLFQELWRPQGNQTRPLRRRHPRADDCTLGRNHSCRTRQLSRVGALGHVAHAGRARRREGSAGIDGMSMARALRGEQQPTHEFMHWEFHERGFQQAVRMGNWKAVRRRRTPRSSSTICLTIRTSSAMLPAPIRGRGEDREIPGDGANRVRTLASKIRFRVKNLKTS